MDEDSQYELITRREVSSIISDEDEYIEEDERQTESEEDKEDEDGEKVDGGEDEENEDDSDSDSDEEEDDDTSMAGLEGAVGPAYAGSVYLSPDEDVESCPICLNHFRKQPVATPENCEHYFCLDCILEWSKNANSCPVDRIVFNAISLRKCYGGKVQKMITVQMLREALDPVLDQTNCEVCGQCDREDRMLLCDECDAGYHMECLTPPRDAVPVEEWFCPQCAPNHPRSGGYGEAGTSQIATPTTSHGRTPAARPTRVIARTQQSERVRSNVNRHRIMQAHTAQHMPRSLLESTWLDETIDAVVAGLNTAVYVRNLTPRARTSRKRKTVKRRKSKSRSSSTAGSKGRTKGTGVKRRRRRKRRTKSRRKLVLKEETTPRLRIAKYLGLGKPSRTSSIPSLTCRPEQSLNSMRADIGAAALSVFGDPFYLDPFNDENEQVELSSAGRQGQGLSRSALRSHQPVARPVPIALPRRTLGVPEPEALPEVAPIPDLLGSIMSGQNMLMMSSCDVVINRDGTLKAVKPVPLPKPTISRMTSSVLELPTEIHEGALPRPQSSAVQASGDAELPYSVLRSPMSLPILPPVTPTSSHQASPQHPPTVGNAHPHLHTPASQRPGPSLNPPGPAHGSCPLAKATTRGREVGLGPVKKAPLKPVWMGVSSLPRMPKVKSRVRSDDGTSSTGGLPESCMNSLSGRQQMGDEKVSRDEQGTAQGGDRLRQVGAGTSSSTSHSSSLSFSSSSDSGSSSISTVRFCINASRNLWHTRQLARTTALGNPLDSEQEEETLKKQLKSKELLLSSRSRSEDKKERKSEIYDPFDPTASDSNGSEGASEADAADNLAIGSLEEHSSSSGLGCQDDIEGANLQIKKEKLDESTLKDYPSSWAWMKIKSEPEEEEISQDPVSGLLNVCVSEEPSTKPLTLEEQATTSSNWTSPTEEGGEKHQCSHSRSSTTSSSQSGKRINSEKELQPKEQCSTLQTRSKSHSSSVTDRKQEPKARKKLKDGRSVSSNPEAGAADNGTLASRSLEECSSTSGLGCQDDMEGINLQIKREKLDDYAVKFYKSSWAWMKIKSEPEEISQDAVSGLPNVCVSEEPSTKPLTLEEQATTSSNWTSPTKGGEKHQCSHSRSSSTSSSHSGKRINFEKEQQPKEQCSMSQARSKSNSSSVIDRKQEPKARKKSKDGWSVSSSPEAEEKRREKRRQRSPQRERKKSWSPSDSELSSTSERCRRKKNQSQSRSWSRDRWRSSSSSDELSITWRRNKDRHEHYSHKGNERRKRSEDERQGRVRCQPRSKSRSRSRSRSRTRSREERKNRKCSMSTSKSKDRSGSQLAERRRARSGSLSRERRARSRSLSCERRGARPRSQSRERRRVRSRSQSRERNEVRLSQRSHSSEKNCVKMSRPTTAGPKALMEHTDIDKEKMVIGSEDKEGRMPEEIETEKPVILSAIKESGHEDITKNPVSLSMVTESEAKDTKTERADSLSMVKESEPEDIKTERLIFMSIGKEKRELGEEEKELEIKKVNPISLILVKDGRGSPCSLSSGMKEVVACKDEKREENKDKMSPETKKDDVERGIKTEPVFPELLPYTSCDVRLPSSLLMRVKKCHERVTSCIAPLSHPLTTCNEEMAEMTLLQTTDETKRDRNECCKNEDNMVHFLDSLGLTRSIKMEPTWDEDMATTAVVPDVSLVTQERLPAVMPETRLSLVTASGKSKSLVKRVTWNLQEMELPAEKTAKISYYNMKQGVKEGCRKPANSSLSTENNQHFAHPAVPPSSVNAVHGLKKGTSSLVPPGAPSWSVAKREEGSSSKDKYMKKLHMQERAVEEVKLAIKPFYQNRDITKEEYKEILRKSVQKVCHSKSGEINPVKVANMVKAYVDMYKYNRKHGKGKMGGKSQDSGTTNTLKAGP
ncbi:PHD and RING finger domain-containing protein 1-like isoform X2 [Megalops cyprinoides]|uniref:PHD and RING finger domain-containing protein 1-like isoform X2 n=1 Tax=Megalops cyprinoides TaxID=118141 RepID=UPI001864B97C|nr:PHD and RING finger domain-containing protein 1-like isoform X2 [Megalops cyprinoides]